MGHPAWDAPYRPRRATPRRYMLRGPRTRSGVVGGQLASHQLDQLLQPAYRPHHHREADQLVLGVPAQHVDTLDIDAVNLGLELQDRADRVMPFTDVSQRGTQDHDRAAQIAYRERLALLRREHRRGPENHII